MKLNVGCGDAKLSADMDWVHFDRDSWPCHVRGDALALPFRSDSVEVVHCSHLLEHVERDDALLLARELKRVLKRSGYVYVATPDAGRARAIGSCYWSALTKHGGAAPGWGHRWQPTVASLRRLLMEAGFVPTWATMRPQGHPPNTHGWPFDLEARFLCRRSDFLWPYHYPPTVTGLIV